MNEYDPLKALLTPQMQRDVQGSKDAALWLDLGPDERHDADVATLFRHFTQMPGFPRVETASGKLRGGSGNFALVIVPPRAGLAARIRGDVDRLRRKLAEMSMPQVDAKTGLCHAFADESVFTNCLVIRGRYTLDLRETFAEIENGNGNTGRGPRAKLYAPGRGGTGILDVILRVGIPRELGGVRIDHARKLVYGACDSVLTTVTAADGSGRGGCAARLRCAPWPVGSARGGGGGADANRPRPGGSRRRVVVKGMSGFGVLVRRRLQ